MSTTQIEIAFQPVHDMAELFSGVSRAGIEDFVTRCKQTKTESHHLLVPGECQDTLTLVPDGCVQLTVISIALGDYGNYAQNEVGSAGAEAGSTAEIGSEKRFAESLESLRKALLQVYRVMAPSGVVLLNVNTLSPAGPREVGPNGIDRREKRARRKGRCRWDEVREKDFVLLPWLVMNIACETGFYRRQLEPWEKAHCMPESVKYRSGRTHEYLVMLTKSRNYFFDRSKLTAQGLPCDKSVFSVPVAHATYGHPAAFHPFLVERYIPAATREGDIVMNFMAGACTTALAALKHNRHSLSLELDPDHLEKARDRLAYFAGDFGGRVEWAPPLNLGVDATPPRPTQATPGFRPHGSDVNFMHQYRTLPRPATAPCLPEPKPDAYREFPLHCLAPFQRRLVEELTRVHRVDADILAPTCLGVWGGCLGNRWVTFGGVSGRTTFANLQMMVAVPHGTGKGCGDIVADPLIRHERLAERIARWRGGTAPSFVVDSATGAAIVEALKSGDDSLLLYSSEAGGLLIDLIMASRAGSGSLFDLLLRGYSVQPYKERRVSRGQYQGQPCLSLVWLAQPHLAHELVGNPQFSERGLASRWLFVERSGSGPVYDDGAMVVLDEAVLAEWNKAVRLALVPRIVGSRQIRQFTWSREAQDVFRMHHNRIVALRQNDWKHHQAIFERSRENAIRIAVGLLAADIVAGLSIRGGEDAAIAERAGAIAEWFEHERFRFFVRRDEDNAATLKNRTLEILVQQPGHAMTFRDLQRRHGIEEAEVKELVRVFPQLFLARREKKSTGRPSQLLELRPRAAA